MKVAIVHNEPIAGKPDSEDTYNQLMFIIEAIELLGHEHMAFPVYKKNSSRHLNLSSEICALLEQLKIYSPGVVFNLVEDFGKKRKAYPAIASLLEALDYTYTGAPFDALLTTTDKVLTKAVLTAYGLPTPLWEQYLGESEITDAQSGPVKKISHIFSQSTGFKTTVPPPWLIKPAWEDASVGIDDSSVFDDEDLMIPKLSKMYGRYNGQPILIEEYIEGREFNVSIFESSLGIVEVLPVAEMVFANWPAYKPKIVNYMAKWDRNSFEFNNTIRKFNPVDAPLDMIKDLALRCWPIFGLRGYARVDMRMDRRGRIYIVDINANPCISPDSGFIAATKEAGYGAKDVIKGILDSAGRPL